MSKFSTTIGSVFSIALSIVIFADEGHGSDARRGGQFPVAGTMHGEAASFSNAIAPMSYTPTTFNRSSFPDTVSAVGRSLGRSHAFSRGLYRPERAQDTRFTINLF